MGLFDWIGEKLSGTDFSAQEAALAEMQRKKEEAESLVNNGIPQAQAAMQAGFGAGQAQGGGSAGESWGVTKLAVSPVNFFANWGAAIGDALNVKGVGTADPGSMADIVSQEVITVKKNLPSIASGLLKYGILAAVVIFAFSLAVQKAKSV